MGGERRVGEEREEKVRESGREEGRPAARAVLLRPRHGPFDPRVLEGRGGACLITSGRAT